MGLVIHFPTPFVIKERRNMVQKTIDKIEKKITNSVHITEENKKEYLSLISSLKNEIDNPENKSDQATADGVDAYLQKLKTSVEEFEVSHPDLVRAVNSLCTMLSNLGI